MGLTPGLSLKLSPVRDTGCLQGWNGEAPTLNSMAVLHSKPAPGEVTRSKPRTLTVCPSWTTWLNLSELDYTFTTSHRCLSIGEYYCPYERRRQTTMWNEPVLQMTSVTHSLMFLGNKISSTPMVRGIPELRHEFFFCSPVYCFHEQILPHGRPKHLILKHPSGLWKQSAGSCVHLSIEHFPSGSTPRTPHKSKLTWKLFSPAVPCALSPLGGKNHSINFLTFARKLHASV